ncbi:hypothetical protein BJX63DRAFT_429251 [Aspergillus granulosus]|uniref:N-acetyltransferase domain-containing protein n=1 Tax=Aspergillus granulosus TaxID=176169 RepID=A0ABR4HS49_9EURO
MPRFPSSLVKEITATSYLAPSQASGIENIPKVTLTIVDTQELAKVSSSNISGVVLRPPLGGYRKRKILARGEMMFPKEIEHTPPQQAWQPLLSPNSNKFAKANGEILHPSGLEHEDRHKGITIPKETCRDHRLGDEENDKEELERLRKEILVNAHKGGQGNNDATASPEQLARCRDGPGTDKFSPENQEIAKARAVPQDDTPDYSDLPGPLHVFITDETKKDSKLLRNEMESQLEVCRELYRKTPRAYPVLTDENLNLSPTPNEQHRRTLAKAKRTLERIKSLNSHCEANVRMARSPKEKQIVQEHAWSDKYIANWEYCPQDILDKDWYRARFQRWLDDSIPRECVVDIFHQAFFHGTAHADGEISMFILDLRNYETFLDPADKESWCHIHETAAGYICNVVRHNKKAEEEEHHRKEVDRKVRLEALHSPRPRSPICPVANIYLRPVQDKDVPELREINNWYSRNSTRSPYASHGSDQIRERIEACRNAQLPFITAVDCRSALSRRPEKILGYALAKEFDHAYACRYTAEVELFVKDGQTNQGIGKCLLDKLLEVCDPLYCSKGGYEFRASTDDRSAYPGGRRRLARLVITLSYADNGEISDHKRVKKWLEEHAGFEEQGVRVKGTDL